VILILIFFLLRSRQCSKLCVFIISLAVWDFKNDFFNLSSSWELTLLYSVLSLLSLLIEYLMLNYHLQLRKIMRYKYLITDDDFWSERFLYHSSSSTFINNKWTRLNSTRLPQMTALCYCSSLILHVICSNFLRLIERCYRNTFCFSYLSGDIVLLSSETSHKYHFS